MENAPHSSRCTRRYASVTASSPSLLSNAAPNIRSFYDFFNDRKLETAKERRERKEGDFDFENYDIEDEQEVEYKKKYEIILEELDNMYWYDKKVYEIIESGESISELSRKTNISYYSLYNTYKKVKKYLKDKI